MLQSIESHRVRRDSETEQQQAFTLPRTCTFACVNVFSRQLERIRNDLPCSPIFLFIFKSPVSLSFTNSSWEAETLPDSAEEHVERTRSGARHRQLQRMLKLPQAGEVPASGLTFLPGSGQNRKMPNAHSFGCSQVLTDP